MTEWLEFERTKEVRAQRAEEAVRLYYYEPPPIKPGGCAGTRTEGVDWGSEMKRWLDVHPRDVVVTVLGKSTDGLRLDGNAHERVAYKMLRVARHLTRKAPQPRLVVAFNVAFRKYENSIWAELEGQRRWLMENPMVPRIVFLTTADEYVRYSMGEL